MASTLANAVAYIEIDDCKIAELISDTGTEPTYGEPIDIPSIMELTAQLQIRSVLREGDAKISGVYTKVTHATGNLRANSVPLDALAVMVGGNIADEGTSPDAKKRLKVGGNAKGKYFKIMGRAVQVDGIDGVAAGAQIVIYKARLTGSPTLGFNNEWANISAEFTAVATNSNDMILEFIVEETQGDLE